MQQYVTSGRAAIRTKTQSHLPTELRLLNGCSFKVLDLDQNLVCKGEIIEEEGKRSRMFKCKMEGSTEQLEVNQADLCTKLNLKANYTLTNHILLEMLGWFSIGQLSTRVGQLLPLVKPPLGSEPAPSDVRPGPVAAAEVGTAADTDAERSIVP